MEGGGTHGLRPGLALACVWLIAPLCCGQDIRLFGGRGSYEGRVEVFHNKQWGTVCNDVWDVNDAAVVCREFGNRTSSASTSNETFFGSGIGPVWFHDVRCSGTELRLQDCPHQEADVNACTHEMDAGVVCEPKDYDLRLVNGSTDNEGRVEIYRGDAWRAVCADSNWGKAEADVVCRDVGYHGGALRWNGDFGTAESSLLGSPECVGTELRLFQCSASVVSSTDGCPAGQTDAVVECDVEVPVSEELSTGAIIGISIGFGLVIVMCCIFSLNCKCRAPWKKREADDTDVYQCNNADSKTYTSNTQGQGGYPYSNSQSESQQDPVSDIDPNMFVFAPKVPPAGFSATEGAGEHAPLTNIEETKEPNGDVPSSPPDVNMDSPTAPPDVNMDSPTAPPDVNMDSPTASPDVNTDSPTAPPDVNMDPPTAPPDVNMDSPTAPPDVNMDPPTAPPDVKMDPPTAPPDVNMDSPMDPTYVNTDSPTDPTYVNTDSPADHTYANTDSPMTDDATDNHGTPDGENHVTVPMTPNEEKAVTTSPDEAAKVEDEDESVTVDLEAGVCFHVSSNIREDAQDESGDQKMDVSTDVRSHDSPAKQDVSGLSSGSDTSLNTKL